MTKNIYGNIVNYQTGESLRPATRAEWQRARDIGDDHTGAHRDTDGTTVYCDGPDEDPEPTVGQLEELGGAVAAAVAQSAEEATASQARILDAVTPVQPISASEAVDELVHRGRLAPGQLRQLAWSLLGYAATEDSRLRPALAAADAALSDQP